MGATSEQYGDKLTCPSSAVKDTGVSCSNNEQGYHGDKQPHLPCSHSAGRSITDPVTTERWPVAGRFSKGISSHSRQGFDTTE